MRDRALDGSADRTDLVIVFVFTRVEFTVLRLLSRRDVARPLEGYAKLSLKKYRPMAARNEDKKVFSGLL